MTDKAALDDLTRKQAILAGTPYIVTKQFPWKLHEMLEQVEKDGMESVVSWLPNGLAFKVHRPDVFVDDIMKNHFQQTKYKSFQRQLNLWGFERNTKESMDRGSYHHPLFIRGRKDLCQDMGRQKIKPESAVAQANEAINNASPHNVVSLAGSSSKSSTSSSSNNIEAAALAALNNAASASTPSQLLASIMAAAAAAKQQQQHQQNPLAGLQALLDSGNSSAPNGAAAQISAAAALLSAAASQQQTMTPAMNNLLGGGNNNNNTSNILDALRLQNAINKQGGAPASGLSALQLLLGGGQQQQSGVFYSTTDPHNPTSSNNNNMNPFAQADADIIQALQRRATLETMLNAANNEQSAPSRGPLNLFFRQQ